MGRDCGTLCALLYSDFVGAGLLHRLLRVGVSLRRPRRRFNTSETDLLHLDARLSASTS
jgi:hypothetical protein